MTPHIVRWSGRFYQWSGACYCPVTDEAVEAAVTQWLARTASARLEADRIRPITTWLLRDTMLAIRSEAAIPDSVTPGTWIKGRPEGVVGPFLATPGGVLDLGRLGENVMLLLPNSPNCFTLAALPVTPDPEAACPEWLAILASTFPEAPSAVQLLQELFGYCLWPDSRFERFFILSGPGNAGKSTVAETLQALLGEGNTCALPLERFGDRFALPPLIGKLANIVFDASEIERSAEGVLKAMVSGEPVAVEQKHLPLCTMRLTAKHLFITNILPRFHDTSDGLWRRLLLVPFDRVCPSEQRDPGLKFRLREELPAIAQWALRGLARLLQRGTFTTFERGSRLAGELRHESNPVDMFLASECVTEPGSRTGRQHAYARYRQWAAANGHAIMSVTRFNREVRAIYPQPEEVVRESRGGDRMFTGFRLHEENDLLHQFRLLSDDQAPGA
jgi:P4 family phage/plasmid primase-like protien